MALKIDFLTKEIFIKIITKGLGVFRTLFLLFFFSVSSELDDFYFAKSIVGVVILINILFEITYSQQLNTHKDNPTFIKKFSIILNKLSIGSSLLLTGFMMVISDQSEIMIHIAILCIWGILNINSNYFLLLYRYKNFNRRVLLYYLLISLFDILLLLAMLNFISSDYKFVAISFSLLLSEFIVFTLLFSKYCISNYRIGNDQNFKLNLEVPLLSKVFFILIVISCIDITDKYFLSFLGEGKITYYTYGLYAPLMIRQSLDIRSNFFVQINKAVSLAETRVIFFDTLKKLIPFFLLGVVLLIGSLVVFERAIQTVFKIEDIQLFKNIIYLGILITPLYMIWDLFYRFYYREDQIKKLLILVIVGFTINILLNYIMGIYLTWGIYGILISTLTVFLFYNLLSFQYFFIRNKE